jgi:hypothetical protein
MAFSKIARSESLGFGVSTQSGAREISQSRSYRPEWPENPFTVRSSPRKSFRYLAGEEEIVEQIRRYACGKQHQRVENE